ncbi:hypothetical protein KUCAC02_032916, partial [Chaenocephalus aceratus]
MTFRAQYRRVDQIDVQTASRCSRRPIRRGGVMQPLKNGECHPSGFGLQQPEHSSSAGPGDDLLLSAKLSGTQRQ